jgi:hypothetical protein
VREVVADSGKDAVEPVRVGVIEKINIQRIVRPAQGIVDELRAESRAANADQQDVFESFSLFWRNFAGMHLSRELFDARVGIVDVGPEFWRRREFRIAQPIMTDHPVLVRVRNRAGFEFRHRGEGPLDQRLHPVEEIIGKPHPADVDGKIEIVVAQEIFLKT